MICATSAPGISWQHVNNPNCLVRDVYKFHLHFHVRIILHHLGISLPHKDNFCKAKSVCYSICDDYGINAAETKMNRGGFYTKKYDIFSNRGKERTLHDG